MTLTGHTGQAPPGHRTEQAATTSDHLAIESLCNLFDAQHASLRESGPPPVADRIEHLGALAAMVMANRSLESTKRWSPISPCTRRSSP